MKPLIPLALAALLAACAPHNMPCLDPHYGCPEFDGADGPGEPADPGADAGPSDPGSDSSGDPADPGGPSDSAGGSGDDPQ